MFTFSILESLSGLGLCVSADNASHHSERNFKVNMPTKFQTEKDEGFTIKRKIKTILMIIIIIIIIIIRFPQYLLFD
jgi:hypothetical protein